MPAISFFRVTVPDQVNSLSVPNLKRPGVAKYVVVKNVSSGIGANSIRINMDGGSTHYWTIAPGETSPVMYGFRGGELVYTDGVSGSATAEIMVWEENS